MFRTNHRPVVIFTLLTLATLAPVATAEVLFVDRFDDSNTATACAPFTGNDCSLRGAIIRANANGEDDEIWMPMEGTYTLTLDGFGLDHGDLDITDNLVINGWDRNTVIIDADGIPGGDRVFDIYAGVTVTIRNVWIRGGFGPPISGSGAGIWNSGTLTLEQSLVSHNVALVNGGGIFNSPSGWLEFDRSVVTNNHAWDSGGAIFNQGDLFVTDSKVGSASAWGDGGCIFNHADGVAFLMRSTIRFCFVSEPAGVDPPAGLFLGGGIFNEGWVNAVNCTFANSDALDAVGGAIFNNGDLDLTNVTFFGNDSPQGSAIFNNSFGEVGLVNTLIDGTCASDPGSFTSFGGNIESPGTTCDLDHASDQFVTNPISGSSGYNGGLTVSYPLAPGSPAVDAGNNLLCPTHDQRGRPRPVDGDGDLIAQCDSGSYEYDPAEIFLDGFEQGAPDAW